MPTTGVCKETYTSFFAKNNLLFLLALNICLLKRTSYIHYLFRFKKDQIKVQILLKSDSKVNAIAPTYMARLDLNVKPTNVGAQKINSSNLKMFNKVLANFRIFNKLHQSRFFLETFLIANISVK